MSDTRRPTPSAKPATAAPKPAGEETLLYSTTEGRQRFPDILQTSYGDKAVIGFDRYGRALGALVPMEAVRVLAGYGDSVDEDVRKRIEKTAKMLIEQLPKEAALCGISISRHDEPELKEVKEIDEARAKDKSARARPSKAPV